MRQAWGRVAGRLTRDEQKKLDRFTREADELRKEDPPQTELGRPHDTWSTARAQR